MEERERNDLWKKIQLRLRPILIYCFITIDGICQSKIEVEYERECDREDQQVRTIKRNCTGNMDEQPTGVVA